MLRAKQKEGVDMAGYSYFRKPVSEMNGTDESIFCDEDSRIDMMKRVWKGKVLPLLAILFCLLGTLASMAVRTFVSASATQLKKFLQCQLHSATTSLLPKLRKL